MKAGRAAVPEGSLAHRRNIGTCRTLPGCSKRDPIMRASIAYFVGAGTVVAAIAVGLGGGFLMANIMNPHEVREVSKVERRAQQAQQSPQPDSQQGTSSTVAASNTPQAPTPYQAAIQQSATTPVVVAPAPSNSPQPSSEAGNAASPPAQPSPPKEAAAANETQSAPAPKAADASVAKQREKPQEKSQEKPQEQASTQPAAREEQAAVQPASREQASSPDNAYAKARDADVKRQAAEQRRAERRQQWTTRRQPRDQELRDVEAKVREDSDAREVIVERDDSDPPRFSDPDRPRNRDFDRSRRFGGPVGFPSINLFGPD
jgi:hypothetical protein